MKISKGLKEQNIIIGNTYDKYGARNPLVRWIMKGFESTIDKFVNQVRPKDIHEVGCGEGYWTLRWIERGFKVKGSDFSNKIIEMAQTNAKRKNLSSNIFKTCSIYDLNSIEDSANLVVCCEVLEHLEQPEKALATLQSIANPYLILSVPREPLWSILNMARGKYLLSFGNTPGHIQRWSQKAFTQLASQYFDVLEVRTPIPWTILLCYIPNKSNNLP